MVVLACRLATLAALAIPIQATACINTFDSMIVMAVREGNHQEVAKIIARLESDFAKDASLEHSNDLAVARLLTGRYDDSIALLKATERRFPGMAIVAANLGTAFELNGNDGEALRWIREGVRRDPKEHAGSEWLHVRILEGKRALAKNSHWLETNTILGVDFGSELTPRASGPMPADATGAPRSLRDVETSVDYQLRERTKFVKPPDPVIADLYAAQGDIEFAHADAGHYDISGAAAGDLYKDALRYGAIRGDLVSRRLAAVDKLFRDNEQKTPTPLVQPHPPLVDGSASDFPLWWVVAGVTIGIAGAWIARRRSRIRKP